MMNSIWAVLIGVGILVGLATGKAGAISDTVFTSATKAFELAIGLAALLAFWSGIMKIAEASGITSAIARVFRPILQFFFPTLRREPKLLGLISMTISANILGLGNVATPLGLQTMTELQKRATHPEQASDETCTFLAFVLGGLCLIPSTLLAIRAQAGSTNPALVIGPILLVTGLGTLVALMINFIACRIIHWRCRKG